MKVCYAVSHACDRSKPFPGAGKSNCKVEPSLRPVDLGRAVGISAQTVRKYERFGFPPPAERAPTGYRRYTARHAEALRTARTLIAGYGWQHALQVMQLVHSGDLAAAHAAVDAAHAALHHERQELETMLGALRTSAAVSPPPAARSPATGILIRELEALDAALGVQARARIGQWQSAGQRVQAGDHMPGLLQDARRTPGRMPPGSVAERTSPTPRYCFRRHTCYRVLDTTIAQREGEETV